MQLKEALGIKPGDVISLVGAGGKTSAGLRLTDELAREGTPVVFTTTTRFLEPVPSEGEALILGEKEGHLLAQAVEALGNYRKLFLARRRLEETVTLEADFPFRLRPCKLEGVSPEFVDRLADAVPQAVIIVEADGARRRLLKAPAPYEPVVPESTTLFVPIAHTDVLGRPLDGEHVHRPEEAARLLGCPPGTLVTEEMVARLLLHPEGGLKGCPPSARIVPFLNQREEASPLRAYRIARSLLKDGRIGNVVIATLWGEEPVRDIVGRVTAIVLAAGGSSRFGAPKQLLPWGDNTMLGHVVDVALSSPVASVVVVLGYRADEVRKAVEGRTVRVLVNERWQDGISTSIRTGLTALALEPDTEAAIFFLADQPAVTPEVVAAVIKRYYQTRKPIIAPTCRGRRGNPVLFDRSAFLELASLKGDSGGRTVIARHPDWVEKVEVPDERVFLDVDTPEDLELINRIS